MRLFCAIPAVLYRGGLCCSREVGFKQGQSLNKWIEDINKMVPGVWAKIAALQQRGL